MHKFFGVLFLCASLVGVIVVAPTFHNALVVRLALAKYESMRGRGAEPNAFLQALITYIQDTLVNGALGGSAASRVTANEKNISTEQELLQAQMNGSAASTIAQAYADSHLAFNDQSIERACRLSNEEVDAQNAAVNTALESKATSAQIARAFLNGPTEGQAAHDALALHNEKYCSQESLARGRCSTLSAMPDADARADTLFTGNGTQTFSKEQYEASRQYIKMATNPVPPEASPSGLESTPAGQRLLLEKMQYAAVMSMAQQSYVKILADRTAQPTTP